MKPDDAARHDSRATPRDQDDAKPSDHRPPAPSLDPTLDLPAAEVARPENPAALDATLDVTPPPGSEANEADQTIDVSPPAGQAPDLEEQVGGDATVAVIQPGDGIDPTIGLDPAEQSSAAGAFPTTIGAYRILRELGRGGMGVVYLAEDPRLKRRIALKVLPEAVVNSQRALDAFEREAQLLAALNHKNIATIFSLEQAQEVHFFTMEFLEGEMLRQQMDRGALDVASSLEVARQIAEGLDAAHERGVVHRDLKPANVMVASDGFAKILDFGIATARGQCAADLGLEETTPQIAGTPGYMSPEQFAQFEELRGSEVQLAGATPSLPDEGRDASADLAKIDVWAFGCLLFELLTGHRALSFRTIEECVVATRLAAIDWDRLPDATPAPTRALLQGCLQPDLSQRIASMSEVCRQLDNILLHHRELTRRAEMPSGPNNLPTQPTSFVGRKRQLAETQKCLQHTCLLTLTGVGGSGKTRIGLEVARQELSHFADGVWLIEFAAVQDEALVPRAIATVLGLKEDPGRTLTDTLLDYLKTRQTLFVFDNCEHLLEPISRLVSQLMLTCPDLKVIASSREAFNVPGEQIYHVEPMQLPDVDNLPPLGELADNEAVALFVERARAMKASFELSETNAAAVAEICSNLDGIPLALELAAARIRVLSANDIAGRLADRFKLLRGGNKNALPHQKTLRAAIDWSYDQLEEEEKTLLRRFSTFVGGWSLDSAEEICSDDAIEDYEVLDLLAALVDKSLVEVRAITDGDEERTRYRSLETIRQYAWEKLEECGESAAMVEQHGAYFLRLATEAAEKLGGPEQVQWFDLLELERGNTRVALQRFVADPESDGERALRLVGALGMYWLVRGYWTEGRTITTEVLALPSATPAGAHRAEALSCLGKLSMSQGDLATARFAFEEALTIRRTLAAPPGIASALNDLAVVDRRDGDMAQARARLEESLSIARELKDTKKTAVALGNLGLVAVSQADNEAAGRYYTDAVQGFRELGDQQGIAVCLQGLAGVAWTSEDFPTAAKLYREALEISRTIGNRRTERNLLSNLGVLAQLDGRLDEARQFHEESVALRRDLGDQDGVLHSLVQIAQIALEQQDRLCARTMIREGLEAAQALPDSPANTELLACAAQFLVRSNAYAEAARVHGLADTIATRLGTAPPTAAATGWVDDAKLAVGTEAWNGHVASGKTLSVAEVQELIAKC